MADCSTSHCPVSATILVKRRSQDEASVASRYRRTDNSFEANITLPDASQSYAVAIHITAFPRAPVHIQIAWEKGSRWLPLTGRIYASARPAVVIALLLTLSFIYPR
jgi:hypothetical protein